MAGDDRDETMNKLLKRGTLACVLMACMAGGQSAATSTVSAPDMLATGTNASADGIGAVLARYNDVQVMRPKAIAVNPTQTVQSGGYTLITGTDVRAAVEAAGR